MAKSRKRRSGAFHTPGLVNASKTLLANIRFASVDDPIKTICITSTTSDEGKTTTATNLACAIASAGHTVLIIDADMRKRCIAGMLDLHPKFNLYSILAGECSIEKAIAPTKFDNLYFLDSEEGIPNPPDILSTHRFSALVGMLKDMFDYVIIDTPPVGMFVDAAIVSSLTDGTIFIVRERSTKKAMVEKSIAQLKASKGRILGIVTTFAKGIDSDYYYAYYSSDGKRVSKKEKAKIDAAATEGSANGNTTNGTARKVSNAQLSNEDIEAWMRKASRSNDNTNDYAKHAGSNKAHKPETFDPISNITAKPNTNTGNPRTGRAVKK
jgi:capsular exopolysaccharide synthesis family protein